MMKRRGFLSNSALMISGLALSKFAYSDDKSDSINTKALVPDLRIRRLSWAGIHLEYDGASLFIDPWISKEIWDGKWNLPIIQPEVTTATNHVAVTHIHNDHWDVAAIKAIYGNKRASIYCGERAAPVIAAHNIPAVRVTPVWEPFLLSNGKFTLIAIPAQDYSGIEQISWVIKAGGKVIYHGGDSMWHGNFHKVSHAFGPFDAAFLPINGADLLVLHPNSHVNCSLNPIQAAAAGKVLGTKILVPIHYGMSDPSYYLEYPEVEKNIADECKKAKVPLEICEPGNWISWKANR